MKDERLSGKIVNKTCPDCGADLVIRQNRVTLGLFLGCSRYPECRHTEELPEQLKMEAAGAQKLPGIST